MKVPFPLISVPKFREDVEKEDKPPFWSKMSAAEQEEHIRTVAQHRATYWGCRMSAVSCNAWLLTSAFLILLFGQDVLSFVQKVLKHVLGV